MDNQSNLEIEKLKAEIKKMKAENVHSRINLYSDLIKNILSNKDRSIFYHGWTSKKQLAENWLSSDIWFYPCTFLETFCLTALEAALTKTFVITRNFGSLAESVGNRGVFLNSIELMDAYSMEWQEKALIELFNVLENKELKNNLIEENYKWAKHMSWENRANDFLENYIEDFQDKNNTIIDIRHNIYIYI